MDRDVRNIRQLAARLRENLVKCAEDPDVDPVHDTRTGTRRLEATVEELVEGVASGEPLGDAARPLLRLLKRMRRAAGPVRDLDVHRKLLEKLMQRPSEGEDAARKPAEAELRLSSLEDLAGQLDTWLKHRRSEQAEGLRKQAAGAAEKLERRLQAFAAELQGEARPTQRKPASDTALGSFARLSGRMPQLDAGNLHDFRKGAKKARYLAELAGEDDSTAQQVAKTLKEIQDEIGDWHDWLVLADDAHTALEEKGVELRALIEGERDRHFLIAMKTAARLRGELMEQWQSLSRHRTPHRATPKPRKKADGRRAV